MSAILGNNSHVVPDLKCFVLNVLSPSFILRLCLNLSIVEVLFYFHLGTFLRLVCFNSNESSVGSPTYLSIPTPTEWVVSTRSHRGNCGELWNSRQRRCEHSLPIQYSKMLPGPKTLNLLVKYSAAKCLWSAHSNNVKPVYYICMFFFIETSTMCDCGCLLIICIWNIIDYGLLRFCGLLAQLWCQYV